MATNRDNIDVQERILNLNIFTSPETHQLLNVDLKHKDASPFGYARSFDTNMDRIALVLFMFHNRKECTIDKIRKVDRGLFRRKGHGEAPVTGSKLKSNVLPALLIAVYSKIKEKENKSPAINFGSILDETNEKQEEEVKAFLEDFRKVIEGAVELGAPIIYKELIPDEYLSDPIPFFKKVRLDNKKLEDKLQSSKEHDID